MISAIVDETVKVKSAAIVCPGKSVALSLFHVIVIGPLAALGTQLDVVMSNIREIPIPVFLTYIVFVDDSPGAKLPHDNDVIGVMQLLSEYTSMLAETAIDPVELML